MNAIFRIKEKKVILWDKPQKMRVPVPQDLLSTTWRGARRLKKSGKAAG